MGKLGGTVLTLGAIGFLIWVASRSDGTAPPAPIRTAISGSTFTPAPPQVQLPPEAQALVSIVADFAARYRAAPNDMVRGGTRPDRGRAICAAIPKVIDRWPGTIVTLLSNSDGHGVLGVQLRPGVTFKTWNNEISDAGDRTLLRNGSPIYQAASQLQVGQMVIFSGTLFPNPVDCIRETSLSVHGAMTDPEFLIRFTAIEPAR